VENVLLGEDGVFKLCDFGSATTKSYLCTNERERSSAEEEINRNTTMMYRAPEMVDLYRKQKINEKVGIPEDNLIDMRKLL
jgi:AP2-associated kinase